MVSLHYKLTKEDYVNFYTYVMWDAGYLRKKRAKNILKQLAIVSVFIGVLYFSGVFRYLSSITLTIILLMFATSVIPLFTGRSSANKEAVQIADDPDNHAIFADTKLLSGDDGVHIKTSDAETKYTWKAIIKKTETDAYYFLFINTIQAIIIPKRVFGNNDEKAEFQKLLLRNLSLEAEIKDEMHAGE